MRRIFWQKNLRPPQMRKNPPSSANAEDFEGKKPKKKLASAGLEPGFVVSLTTALPTTPSHSSLVSEFKTAYIKKIQKKKKISFIGKI